MICCNSWMTECTQQILGAYHRMISYRPTMCVPADFYMSLYNVIFTSMTPLVIGALDADVSKEMSRKYPGQ